MISAHYHVLVGGQFLPGRAFLGRAAELLASYSRKQRLTCCDLQGGFFIDIDGVPWSDDGTVDELWMTGSWVTALAALMSDAPSAEAPCMPWEESRLVLKRKGDRLVMEDIHYSGNVSMRRVAVDFGEFLQQMLPEVGVFDTLSREVVAAARAERDAGSVTRHLSDVLEHVAPVVEHPSHRQAMDALRTRAAHWLPEDQLRARLLRGFARIGTPSP